ncbi:MAG: hypothetical protein CMC02_05840 [Flavobacteriaceae bacterium]|nr:hypothetical protein [Flavobacteriaceae bacterium]
MQGLDPISETNKQLILINQLDEEEKKTLIKIINSMLTEKRMKNSLDDKVSIRQYPAKCVKLK